MADPRHVPATRPGQHLRGRLPEPGPLEREADARGQAAHVAAGAVVFLSYRRLRTAEYIAGRIVEVVSKEFGDGAIFRDLATISAGQDADQASNRDCKGAPPSSC